MVPKYLIFKKCVVKYLFKKKNLMKDKLKSFKIRFINNLIILIN